MIIGSRLKDNDRLVAEELSKGGTVYMEPDDDSLVRRLETEVGKYDLEANGGKRMECWLILNDATSLWMFQTLGLRSEICEKADIFATTMEDLMAKTLFVKLPGGDMSFPSLDRRAVALDGESVVHLVVAGFSALSEALVINAALVAHYPNYCRNKTLRTRISVIDDGVIEKSKPFIQRYRHLFDNSYYRTLNLSEAEPKCVLHRPMYEGRREDFVDVEWEFIDGNIRSDAVRQKMKEWSASGRQQLTIAICNEDHGRNVSEALSLPDEVYLSGTAVLCHTDEQVMFPLLKEGGRYSGVKAFGREICSVDTLRMLKSMAMHINYIYDYAFSIAAGERIAAPSSVDKDRMLQLWNGLKVLQKQYSNYFHAMTLGTKMHSMGHEPEDWDDYYALSKDEIMILTEVEHNRWSVEELILGYRPATDEEQSEIEKDISSMKRAFRDKGIHYDLRSYDDLKNDGTGKNVNVYDYILVQSIPLIMKSCLEE